MKGAGHGVFGTVPSWDLWFISLNQWVRIFNEGLANFRGRVQRFNGLTAVNEITRGNEGSRMAVVRTKPLVTKCVKMPSLRRHDPGAEKRMCVAAMP